MPYRVIPYKRGFVVVNTVTRRRFSKRPMPRARANRQLAVLRRVERGGALVGGCRGCGKARIPRELRGGGIWDSIWRFFMGSKKEEPQPVPLPRYDPAHYEAEKKRLYDLVDARDAAAAEEEARARKAREEYAARMEAENAERWRVAHERAAEGQKLLDGRGAAWDAAEADPSLRPEFIRLYGSTYRHRVARGVLGLLHVRYLNPSFTGMTPIEG